MHNKHDKLGPGIDSCVQNGVWGPIQVITRSKTLEKIELKSSLGNEIGHDTFSHQYYNNDVTPANTRR